ncbi:MAG: excalibur calcium-binding domain-containing protein, partial [Propionibacteriaceae bacterium]|nr:excalibur calcium-binding domain-containing protein [Propionibacteriaceae bacterium]
MTTLAGPTQSTSRDRAVAKRPQRTGQRRLPWTAAGLGLILSGLSTAGWLVQADAAVVYQDCSAVWEAIGQPLSVDDPGYSSRLDADGDGVACELDPREGSRAGGGAVVDAGLDPIP